MKKTDIFDVSLFTVSMIALAVAFFHVEHLEAQPVPANIMPSAEYRACLDKKIAATPDKATFFPMLIGAPEQETYSPASEVMQDYYHKGCTEEFQTWLVRDCLQPTGGADPRACLQRDQAIIHAELNDLGRQVLATHYAGAIGTGITVKVAQ